MTAISKLQFSPFRANFCRGWAKPLICIYSCAILKPLAPTQHPCQSLNTLATPSRLTHIFNCSCAILKALAFHQDPHQSLNTLASPSRPSPPPLDWHTYSIIHVLLLKPWQPLQTLASPSRPSPPPLDWHTYSIIHVLFLKLWQSLKTLTSHSRPSPVPQDLRQSLATPSRLTHLFNYSFSILKALAVPKDTRQ